MKVQPLEWNPYKNNPLDWIKGRAERPLATKSGLSVTIKQVMTEFKVTIGDSNPMCTVDNLTVCRLLNTNEVGIIVEGELDG